MRITLMIFRCPPDAVSDVDNLPCLSAKEIKRKASSPVCSGDGRLFCFILSISGPRYSIVLCMLLLCCHLCQGLARLSRVVCFVARYLLNSSDVTFFARKRRFQECIYQSQCFAFTVLTSSDRYDICVVVLSG